MADFKSSARQYDDGTTRTNKYISGAVCACNNRSMRSCVWKLGLPPMTEDVLEPWKHS